MIREQCGAAQVAVGGWARSVLLAVLLGLVASASWGASLTLAWNAVTQPGVAGYRVHWGTASGAYTSQANAGTATSRTIDGLTEGQTYYFAVTSLDAQGRRSPYSNQVSATAPRGAPVADFTVSASTGAAPLTVNFTSTSTGTIASYAWNFGDGTTSTVRNPAKTYSSPGTYTVALTVSGTGGSNTRTRAGLVTVTSRGDVTAPSIPGSLTAIATGTTAIQLNWNAATDNVGVAGYRIERCAGTGCTAFAQIATANGTTYANSGLVASATYRYRIRAADGAGNLGSYSTVATATTPSVPSAPSAALVDGGLLVDEHRGTGTASNVNGMLEPGETVLVVPVWAVAAGSAPALTGSGHLSGTGSSALTLADRSASYGSIAAGEEADCREATGNCYRVTLRGDVQRPSVRWGVTFTETLSTGRSVSRTIPIGHSFTDVNPGYLFYPQIEGLVWNYVTVGFSDGTFRPSSYVTRLQAAMFLARGKLKPGGDAAVPVSNTIGGTSYTCSMRGVSRYSDLDADDVGCKHIHYLASRNVSVRHGCQASGGVCPDDIITRASMAVMVAGAMASGGDAGVPYSGTFTDTGVARSYNCATTGGSRFPDVPSSANYCRHANYLWARGVVDGYADGDFNPGTLLYRGQMAKFIANAFRLEAN